MQFILFYWSLWWCDSSLFWLRFYNKSQNIRGYDALKFYSTDFCCWSRSAYGLSWPKFSKLTLYIFHETLVLLLFYTHFSLLPSDIILGYNFCSLEETDQKLKLKDHIVVLVLIFLLTRSFYFMFCVQVLFHYLISFLISVSLVLSLWKLLTLQGFQTLTASLILLAQDHQKLCGVQHCFIFQRSQFRYLARGQLSYRFLVIHLSPFLKVTGQ